MGVGYPVPIYYHAKEVMFSALVSLFVSRITEKNYSTNFHKIRWKDGRLDTEETIRFWW